MGEPAINSGDGAGLRVRHAMLFAVTAFLPPFVAEGLEVAFKGTVAPWLFFNIAVLVSGWLGGLKSGLTTTLVSVVIAWWFFIPPQGSATFYDPRHVASATVFVIIGTATSLFLERLRRARIATAAATSELRENQRVVQAVVDYAPGIVVAKNLDGRILLFNHQFAQAVGSSSGQLRGRSVYELFSPGDARRRRETDLKVINSRRPVTIEETVTLHDGRHVFLAAAFPLLDEHGAAFGVCWMEADITARKRAEEELRRTAADLKQAQRVGHIGSWTWNLETDSITWSEELYRIHHRDPHLPAPRYSELGSVFTPESVHAIRDAVERLRMDGEPFELELETCPHDASSSWIALRGEAIRDESGRVTGVRGTSQDITHLKEVERLKQEWTSVIAHDLRQPIGAIKMAAALLPDLHAAHKDDEEGAITARIGNAAGTLARMVDDLLDVSRLEAQRLSLDRSWVDPCKTVHETLDRLAYLTTGCTVTMTSHGEPATVFADTGRIEQVLGNLLSNAAKYGDKGAEIRVEVTTRRDDVHVSVTNRGPGIPPEEVGRLFTRFSRTKTRKSDVPGLGLGLYIAKGLVEAHGGRMWVDSVPNETTTFHFTLPATRPARSAA
jgi:PAS domain S-box-containing protein